MATIVEVARRAGVSTSTVSHVVNRTRFVSDGARTRVERAIRTLGYRPNALARSLRVGRSHTLGLVIPDSANPFFAEVGRAIELAAFEAGFSVILCNTENDRDKEQLYLAVLAKKQVEGIVLVAADERSEPLEALRRGPVPVVALDREWRGLALDAVLTDDRLGGRLATSHLVALGHRRIGCITGPPRLSTNRERLAGYRSALRDAGLPRDDALVVHADFHPSAGAAALRALLALPRPPTAVFAFNDLMAMGALSAAAAAGRRVPGELAVVGYDDIELAAFAAPALTTVAQPKAEVARRIVEVVLDRIREPRRAPRRVVLPVKLEVRRSCGAAREGGWATAGR